MAIEIATFPTKTGDFPVRYVTVITRLGKLVEGLGWNMGPTHQAVLAEAGPREAIQHMIIRKPGGPVGAQLGPMRPGGLKCLWVKRQVIFGGFWWFESGLTLLGFRIVTYLRVVGRANPLQQVGDMDMIFRMDLNGLGGQWSLGEQNFENCGCSKHPYIPGHMSCWMVVIVSDSDIFKQSWCYWR